MAKTVHIERVDQRENRTILSYRCGDEKFTFEILGGLHEFRQWIVEQMPDTAESVAAIGLAHWLANNTTTTDLSQIDGTSYTIDLVSGSLQVAKD